MKKIVENKKAYFDYEILETFLAGIKLKGFEVKSVKEGNFNIVGSYSVIKDNEVWLINSHIPLYKKASNIKDYDERRTRKLLLKKSEIKYLIGKLKEKGLTLIPLEVYNINNLIKIKLGLGKIKRKIDKRETIKKRETEKKLKQFKNIKNLRG